MSNKFQWGAKEKMVPFSGKKIQFQLKCFIFVSYRIKSFKTDTETSPMVILKEVLTWQLLNSQWWDLMLVEPRKKARFLNACFQHKQTFPIWCRHNINGCINFPVASQCSRQDKNKRTNNPSQLIIPLEL